jgi:hypothetical protein
MSMKNSSDAIGNRTRDLPAGLGLGGRIILEYAPETGLKGLETLTNSGYSEMTEQSEHGNDLSISLKPFTRAAEILSACHTRACTTHLVYVFENIWEML